MMMKSIAQEVAPHRIRVNSVCPGAVRTPINMEAWGTPEAYRELMKLIPYKRIGEPDDIGRACVWLASDDSSFVNGHALVVDGGMTGGRMWSVAQADFAQLAAAMGAMPGTALQP